MEKEKEIKKDRRILTLFIITIFSLLIAMSSTIPSTWTRISFQAVLLFGQIVILKNVLDDYYETI